MIFFWRGEKGHVFNLASMGFRVQANSKTSRFFYIPLKLLLTEISKPGHPGSGEAACCLKFTLTMAPPSAAPHKRIKCKFYLSSPNLLPITDLSKKKKKKTQLNLLIRGELERQTYVTPGINIPAL